jgi:signal transduction histidine kinase/ligand-binding sensor domain-containing protein/CheY-like chemotaxis protein/AraC-like DNA-binding protein
MRIRLILITIFFIWYIIPTHGQYDHDVFDNYSVVPGQPSLPAVGVFKDSQGFIWSLHIGGLYRFDGINMKVYSRNPYDSTSLSNNLVRTILFEDSLNRLWISNFSNNIDILDKNTDKINHIVPEKTSIENKKFGGLQEGCQDARGNVIGVALGYYLVKYDMSKNIAETILISPEYPDSSINKVTTLFKDRDNNIWIGTWRGLMRYHDEDGSFSRPALPEQGSDLLNGFFITDMIQDDNGIYWIGTRNGLFKYDPKAFSIRHFVHLENNPESISHNLVRQIHEYPPDSGRTLLIHTRDGLDFFEKQNGKVKSYIYDREDPATTHMQVVYDEIVDETGRLWLCSDNYKLIILTPREDVFKNIQIMDESGHHYIGASFSKDEEKNLWVGTAYGGLFKFDSNLIIRDRFQFSPADGWRNNFFIYSLYQDGEILWIGFAGGGLGRLNIKTREFERIPSTVGPVRNPVYRIYEITRDRSGVLWFCGANQIYYYNTNDPNAEVKKIRPVDGLDPFAMSVYEDKDGNLWFPAPQRGIYYLSVENRADTMFTLFKSDKNDPQSLITDQISTVCQDNQGNYWIGSDLGLIRYFPEDTSFSLFDPGNKMARMAISNLKRDIDGNLWCISDQGIMRITPGVSGEKAFRIINSHDGMPFSAFYPWEIHMDQDGIIYCGGVRGSGNGFFYFNPRDLYENKFIPPIVLTSFKVRNEDFKMDSSINLVKEIKLDYHQNYLSFEFAALNYLNPEGNNYAYKLEGFDEDWIYSGTRPYASYTGVPPGTYTFRAKGSNNDGYWNEEGTSVKIIINPPPWRAWWAYFLYGLALITLFIAWRRYDLKRQRLKKDLEIEQVEAQKLKEVDKLKSRFFANISHEFRTPLTLILGPLEKLHHKIRDTESEQDFNIIQRNARRLQQLINQLLNLSKIESGKMKLQTREEDIVSLTRGYVQSFESLAQQKNIALKFHTETEHQLVYLDRDKIEKILYNLLSNALKFTQNGGEVSVNLKDHDDHISIYINDTGPGMDRDQLDHIFDRFYRGDETHHVEGSGIGLALTRELVELHHGRIHAKSEKEKGSSFEVIIKKGKDHLADHEVITSPEEEMDFVQATVNEDVYQDNASVESPLSEQDILTNGSRPLMLIVEDNKDLRHYIRGYFTKEYEVLEAEDGLLGLEKALEFLPDIIISDVMMPNMDGFELGGKLKTDHRTSHIPLILLTARASSESKMEGLETGADDFITKPFDPKELQVRVQNLIEQRKRLAEHYRNNIDNPGIFSMLSAPTSGISGFDRKFLEKAIKVILDNLTDADFSVEQYSDKMAMSRTHLHRKLKNLLSLPPSDLIRYIRLKKAAEMLKQQAGNVTQVAFEVGFNNLSYFAKCFQEEFGCLPSEYK